MATPEERRALLRRELLKNELSAQENASAPVIQEQSPDVSAEDRLLIKNYAQSPEKGAEYLKKKLPDHTIRVQNGEIQLKAPGDKEFKVVDPDTGFFAGGDPREMLRDAGDVLYDVGSGIVQGAGSAAAALGVGGATGGAGALPAGMAASGAIGAGAEALRQKLGAMAGIPQEVSGEDVALSGALGAVGTGLFGTGAKAGTKALQASNRGAIGRLWDAGSGLRDKLGSASSGVNKKIIEYTKNNLPWLKQISQEEAPVTKLATDVMTDTAEKFNQVKTTAGQNIADAVDNAPPGAMVDVSGVRGRIVTHLEKLKKQQAKDPLDTRATKISAYEGMLNMFGAPKVVEESIPDAAGYGFRTVQTEIPPPNKVSVGKAYHDMKAKLEELADVKNMKNEEFASRFGKNMSKEDKQIAIFADKLRRELGDQIADVTGTVEDNAIYNQAMKDQKVLNSWIKTPAQTEKKLTNMFGTSAVPRETAARIDQRYGTKLTDAAMKLKSYRTFAEPNSTALSAEGSTSTSRTIGAGAAGGLIGGGLGYFAGRQMGDGMGGVGATLGTVGGGSLGALLGGPAGLKAYMQAAKATGKLDDATRALKTGGLPALYNKLFEEKAKPVVKQQTRGEK